MTCTVAIWPTTSNDENEWDYVLSNFQVDQIYILGPYECTNNIMRDAPRADTFADLPEGKLVVLAPKTSRNFVPTISLEKFKHPKNAIYVFGPNNEHLSDDDIGGRTIDHVVCIPTSTEDEMFSHVAAAVVLWSRNYG